MSIGEADQYTAATIPTINKPIDQYFMGVVKMENRDGENKKQQQQQRIKIVARKRSIIQRKQNC